MAEDSKSKVLAFLKENYPSLHDFLESQPADQWGFMNDIPGAYEEVNVPYKGLRQYFYDMLRGVPETRLNGVWTLVGYVLAALYLAGYRRGLAEERIPDDKLSAFLEDDEIQP